MKWCAAVSALALAGCHESPEPIIETQVEVPEFGTPVDLVGLDERPVNKTCLAPERPPIGPTVELGLSEMFNGVAFTYAVDLIQHPVQDDRWYVLEKGLPWDPDTLGLISSYVDIPGDEAETSEFADLSDRVIANTQAGLLGMALHPEFDVNGEVYLSYTGVGADPFTLYVSRFISSDGGMTLDIDSEEVLIALDQPSIYNQGGRLLFGPDGYLWGGFGNGGLTSDDFAQETSNLLGSIWRIDVDEGDPYAIPLDNPFGMGGGAPEIWAWGFKNPWRFSFDRLTDELWVGDPGWDTWEEINLVERGENYGWPVLEGYECLVVPCEPALYQDPLLVHLHDDLGGDGEAIVGGFVYRGDGIPELRGTYIYGDIIGRVFGLYYDTMGNPFSEILLEGVEGLRSFTEDRTGELYVVADKIYRVVSAGSLDSNGFPSRLSETGCVKVNEPTQKRDGLLPYSVNTDGWMDGATVERWMALPEATTIDVAPSGEWSLPIGSVLMQDLALVDKLVETRILVRHDDGDWAGYSYRWREDGSDAELLSDAEDEMINNQLWHYPSSVECLECHRPDAGGPLGLRTEQLDRSTFYNSTSRWADQLETLESIGLFTSQLVPSESSDLFVDPHDGSAELEARVRSWMDVNCASCHRGEEGDMDLLRSTPHTDMGLCNVEPQDGDLGVAGAQRLTPGNPESSLLALRLSSDDVDVRMPPFSHVVDATGVALIDEWITAWREDCTGVNDDHSETTR